MSLTARLEKARSAVSQLGVSGSVTHVARRLLTTVPGGKASRIFLVVLSEPRPTPEAAGAAAGHTFRFAERADLERLVKVHESGIVSRDLQSFDGGCRCLLQYEQSQLVGYTWIGGSQLVELMWGLHFNMPDDMVYNYNGFTLPRYRGTSFQALRHLKVLEHTRAEGKRRLLGYVDHLNYKSLRGVQKSGYRRVGVIRGAKRNGAIHFSLTVEHDCWAEIVRAGPVQS